MLKHARNAVRFTGTLDSDALAANDEKFAAVLWSVCIIGEAASRLEDAGYDAGNLPLRAARNMRNALVHGYPEIDPKVVVRTVREDLPDLISTLERILGGALE